MAQIDPIAREDYRKDIYRDPNPERIARIERAAEAYHAAKAIAAEARQVLDDEIVAAHQTGHSFKQLKDASGIAISGIQGMLAKRGIL